MDNTKHRMIMERKAMMHQRIAQQRAQYLGSPEVTVTVGWDDQFDWLAYCNDPAIKEFAPGSNTFEITAVKSKILSILGEAQRKSADRFVVFARSGQHFMQCLSSDNGCFLEKREGGESQHWQAGVHPVVEPASQSASVTDRILRPLSHSIMLLTIGQVAEALGAYLTNDLAPAWLKWEPIQV